MPAEWEKHAATWLSWPKDPATFPPEIIADVEQTYVRMILELAKGEALNLLVDDDETKNRVSSLLGTTEGVAFYKIKSADVWLRDYGPIFVKNEEVAAVKWNFNAWGNKYDELKFDNETGMKVAQVTGLKIFEPGVVLEGGSIEVNGLGSCLTTRQCLLNENRNPKLGAEEIEEYLKQYLGITNLIWLESGISGDDTDGHVDDVARFVDQRTIVCMVEDNPREENHIALKKNFELLKKAKDQARKEFKVVPIKMPRRVERKSERLPASYANFYIGNAVVLVPIFEDPNDEKALETLKRFFPDRQIVGVDCRSLAYGLGAVHCVTQQHPAP